MSGILEATEHFTLPTWAGSVPTWLMALSFLGILWKGLPAVLDSWANSVAKEREHREREIQRLENQIEARDRRLEEQQAASDKQHQECLDGQRTLREEVNRLQGVISGMVMQLRQMQLSAANLGVDAALPPAFSSMLESLDKPRGPQ